MTGGDGFRRFSLVGGSLVLLSFGGAQVDVTLLESPDAPAAGDCETLRISITGCPPEYRSGRQRRGY